MTDSGASTVSGSGVTRAIAAAAPARCPAYGPTSASPRSVARFSIAMNAQRWVLGARRAGLRRGSVRGAPGRAAGRGSGGPRACGPPRPRRSSAAPRGTDDLRVGAGRAGQGDPGEPPHAATLRDAENCSPTSGSRSASTAAARSAASSGGRGRRARRPGNGPRNGDASNSYSHECWPPSITMSTTGMASGSPARAATAALRNRSKWRSGTTASSSRARATAGPGRPRSRGSHRPPRRDVLAAGGTRGS